MGGCVLALDRLDPAWPGVTFPGGHVEPRESFVESVIREVKEETGLNIRDVQLCGVHQWTEENGRYRYIVFLYRAGSHSGELKSSAEGQVFWVEKSRLKEYILADGFERMLEVFENDALSENYYWFESGEWKSENR